MTVESLDQKLDSIAPEALSLEGLLTILEQHDGLCLDNEAERINLADVLATALKKTVGDSAINLPQPAISEQDRAGISPHRYTE